MRDSNRVNWFLVIIISVILLSFIILPPVLRFMDKDSVENPPVSDNNSNNDSASDIVSQIKDNPICTKVTTDDNFDVEDKIMIFSSDGVVTVVARTVSHTFLYPVQFDTAGFEIMKNNYNAIENVFYNYTLNDNSYIEEYRITLNDDNNNTYLDDIRLSKSLSEIASYYQSNGYICE